jgi:hypothetical protein
MGELMRGLATGMISSEFVEIIVPSFMHDTSAPASVLYAATDCT